MWGGGRGFYASEPIMRRFFADRAQFYEASCIYRLGDDVLLQEMDLKLHSEDILLCDAKFHLGSFSVFLPWLTFCVSFRASSLRPHSLTRYVRTRAPFRQFPLVVISRQFGRASAPASHMGASDRLFIATDCMLIAVHYSKRSFRPIMNFQEDYSRYLSAHHSLARELILIVYVLIATATLWHLRLYPSVVPGGDAMAYVSLGHTFPSLVGLGTVRTYGYPLWTWVYSQIGGGRDAQACALIGGVVQLFLYGLAVFWLVSQFQGRVAGAIEAGLLLNPVLVAIAGDMLTEAPTLILAVLIMVCVVKLGRSDRPLAWAAAGALLTNFALMVRPLNIILIIAWNAAILSALRAKALVFYAAAWAGIAAIVWAPQVLHNLTVGNLGVLPAFPILSGQIKWGIIFGRYSSIVISKAEVKGVFSPNPWCVDPSPTLFWYISHPLSGLATNVEHLLSAFSFGHLLTYTYDQSPSFVLAGVMWAVVALGALQGVRLFWHNFRQPECVALAVTFVLSVGVMAFVVPENRFAAIPLGILSVLAFHLVLTCHRKARLAFGVAALIAVLGGQFVNGTYKSAFVFPERGLQFRCVPEWSK
jgi:hypothetical protein